MTEEHEDFVNQLPFLLRLLADPTTPHTAHELWCRIRSIDWGGCVPVLKSELDGGVADVKRLVLAIISEEAEQMGCESVEQFLPTVVSLLSDEDRLVRMSAIHTVESLKICDQDVIAALRHVIAFDEPILASQALATLLKLDAEHVVIKEIAVHFHP